MQDNELLDTVELSVDDLSKSTYTTMTATFGTPVEVTGSFDIVIAHIGGGRVLTSNIVASDN